MPEPDPRTVRLVELREQLATLLSKLQGLDPGSPEQLEALERHEPVQEQAGPGRRAGGLSSSQLCAVNHDDLRWERRGDKPPDSLFFVSPTGRNQTDLLATQLDLEFIAGFEVQHGGVCLANEKVAVELHRGDIAQAAATLPVTTTVSAG